MQLRYSLIDYNILQAYLYQKPFEMMQLINILLKCMDTPPKMTYTLLQW